MDYETFVRYYRQAVANLESAENVGQASMFESA